MRNKVEFDMALALFWYNKGDIVQSMLHKLKYKDREDIGKMLGRYAGEQWETTLKNVDYIIPIPLHPDKHTIRGYNQSEVFAEGIAEKLGTPMLTNVLEREIFTQTQTKKNTLERWHNVQDIFKVSIPAKIENCRILLVDDVVTSGATLESATMALQNVCNNITISYGVIAIADHWA